MTIVESSQIRKSLHYKLISGYNNYIYKYNTNLNNMTLDLLLKSQREILEKKLELATMRHACIFVRESEIKVLGDPIRKDGQVEYRFKVGDREVVHRITDTTNNQTPGLNNNLGSQQDRLDSYIAQFAFLSLYNKD